MVINFLKSIVQSLYLKIWLRTTSGKEYAKKYKRRRKMELAQILKGEKNEN
tara:strand:- start:5977 stop:6129 length:153 start_codon:yes stop_codon:yes gene_type:complete